MSKTFYISKVNTTNNKKVYESEMFTWDNSMSISYNDFVYVKKNTIVQKVWILPKEAFTVTDLTIN